MPHGLKFAHVLLYGSLIITVIAIALYTLASFGKPQQ